MAKWLFPTKVLIDEATEDLSSSITEDFNISIIDGRNSGVSFDKFPYYLDEEVKSLLTNAGYLHLKQKFSKFTQNLCFAKRVILLTGPTGSELYVQKLAKALAHKLESKLLILNGKYFNSNNQNYFSALEKTLEKVPKTTPLILYFRDIHMIDFSKAGDLFKHHLVDRPVLILGSKIEECETGLLQQILSGGIDVGEALDEWAEQLEDELMTKFWSVLGKTAWKIITGFGKPKGNDTILQHMNINITPPQDSKAFESWTKQLEEDTQTLQAQDNRTLILDALASNAVECTDIDSVTFSHEILTTSYIEKVIATAITHHLINTQVCTYVSSGRLAISSQSLTHGLETIKRKMTTPTPIPIPTVNLPDNEFETSIKSDIITPKEIGITFENIGGLDKAKEMLKELVMLPLQEPELFQTGGLIKPCKGILLFGPPGTGKTMLAKAVAAEAGASFINVSMSTMLSKWLGDAEKYVKAIFTVAAKVAPAIIFIDEVDSFLGKRSDGEHTTSRNMKNEFMAKWDGLLSNGEERFLVLAATNRPFDLDDAIIRRFERRIMVGLPEEHSREQVLRAVLSKEQLSEDFNFSKIASTTEGYSASDLKNLCVAAAYRRVREVLKQRNTGEESKSPLSLRPLCMEDIIEAKNEVSSSLASVKELQEWNELYGEGGSRKKQQLSYYM